MPDELGMVLPLGPERTVEQALARELRRAIIDGRLRPGTRLRYRDLAEQFEVSVTPVRIALRELLQEGLVDMRPHEGARVTPLSVEELEEVYAARSGYEGWLARCGAPELSDADLAKMERRLVDVEGAAAKDDVEAYLRSAWSHRSVCYHAARRESLREKAHILFLRSARYNFLSLRLDGRMDEAMAVAQELHEACVARDGPLAMAIIRRALDETLSLLAPRLAAALTDGYPSGRVGTGPRTAW